jgi:hypothetical protein
VIGEVCVGGILVVNNINERMQFALDFGAIKFLLPPMRINLTYLTGYVSHQQDLTNFSIDPTNTATIKAIGFVKLS